MSQSASTSSLRDGGGGGGGKSGKKVTIAPSRVPSQPNISTTSLSKPPSKAKSDTNIAPNKKGDKKSAAADKKASKTELKNAKGDTAKNVADNPGGFLLPEGMRGLMKHLMYDLHVTRPSDCDRFCYEWFANRIAERRAGTFNADMDNDDVWQIAVQEPHLLSAGREKNDNDEDDYDSDEIDMENDPLGTMVDEAARRIQSGFRDFLKRKRLRTRRLEQSRRKRMAEERMQYRMQKEGHLHWTATEADVTGQLGLSDAEGDELRIEAEQARVLDADERKRREMAADQKKSYETRKLLAKSGADKEEADLAAAKIQSQYRVHQIDKTKKELDELEANMKKNAAENFAHVAY